MNGQSSEDARRQAFAVGMVAALALVSGLFILACTLVTLDGVSGGVILLFVLVIILSCSISLIISDSSVGGSGCMSHNRSPRVNPVSPETNHRESPGNFTISYRRGAVPDAYEEHKVNLSVVGGDNLFIAIDHRGQGVFVSRARMAGGEALKHLSPETERSVL